MLYWKYSPNRIFILNEYWILVPTTLIANYFIISKIRCHKKKLQDLKKLKEEIERYQNEKKIRRIVYLTCGLSGLSYISVNRGGADFIDVDYIDCGIEKGLRFLDNARLRKIIHDLYRNKRRGKIIYITATAVCHLANRYGQTFLALPFAIGDFGVTNLYQTIRKTVVTILLGGVGPLVVVGGPVALTFASVLMTLGLRLAFTYMDKILTSPIDETISAKNLKPRIADVPDVVTVNFRNKITITTPAQEKGECLLAEQVLFNRRCQVKSTEIPSAINLVSHDLKYSEVVNMKDMTGLDRVEFSDSLDLGQAEPSISEPRTGRTVNFLEKFGDPRTIDEMDTWDTSDYNIPEKRDLKTRT